jgi:hypothetical protein
MNPLESLKGYRTYIGLVACFIYAVLIQMQVVESNEALWGLIALWTGASFRAAVK